MKKQRNYLLLSVIVITSFLVITIPSCQLQQPEEPTEIEELKSLSEQESALILGEQLDNPYTVENMKAAISSLKGKGQLQNIELKVEPTHLYVRFLLANSEEVDILEEDNTLEIYDHPLDYEILAEGNSYHDPTLPKSQITWQYTLVPFDYDFPDLTYEILDEIFLIEEEVTEAGQGRPDLDAWYSIEDEAIRITDNIEPDDPDEIEANARRSKFYPNGRVTVQFRDVNNPRNRPYVGVQGVKVRARYFVKTKSTYTRSGGYYRINSGFRNKPRYSIEWETSNYKISNSIGFSYNHKGPKQKKAWNPAFVYSPTSTSWAGGTMLNAIASFRTQATAHGLRQASGGTTLKIRPIFEDRSSNVINASFRHHPSLDFTKLFLYNDIRFFIEPDDDTGRIWATMMHELGHMSHIFISASNFQSAYLRDPMMVESWASAVEFYLTPQQYGRYTDRRADQRRRDILNTNGTGWQYSSFFIDLRDNTNQRLTRPRGGGAAEYANDNVSGYSLGELQNTLTTSRTLRDVENHLINRFNNRTERNIGAMRAFYEDIKDIR